MRSLIVNIDFSSQLTMNVEDPKSCLENLKSAPIKTIELAIKIISELGGVKASSDFFSSFYHQQKTGSPQINRMIELIETDDQSLLNLARENGYESSQKYVLDYLERAFRDSYSLSCLKLTDLRDIHYSCLAIRQIEKTVSGVNDSFLLSDFSPFFDLIEKRLSEIDTIEKARALGVLLLESEISQFEEIIKKRSDDYRCFKNGIIENAKRTLFSKDPEKRRKEYLKFASSFYRYLEVLIAKNQDVMFYDQTIPYLIGICYTGWEESSSQICHFINQLTDQKNLRETHFFRIAHKINMQILDDLFFISAPQIIIRSVFWDNSEEKIQDKISNVHYIRSIRQLAVSQFGLGVSKYELNQIEPSLAFLGDGFLRIVPDLMKEKCSPKIIVDQLKDFYRSISDEEKEMLFSPILDQYKKDLLSGMIPPFYPMEDVRNLYKKLEETSEIEGFDEYLSILKEIHQQFIDLGEIPPFSVQTPKEKIELDLEKSVIGQALKRKIFKEQVSLESRSSSSLTKRSSEGMDEERGKLKISGKRKGEDFVIEQEHKGIKKKKVEILEWRELFENFKNRSDSISEEEENKIEHLITQLEHSETEQSKNEYLIEQKKRIRNVVDCVEEKIAFIQTQSLKRFLEEPDGSLSEFGAALIGSASRIFTPVLDPNINGKFNDVIVWANKMPLPLFIKDYLQNLILEGKEYRPDLFSNSSDIRICQSQFLEKNNGWFFDLSKEKFDVYLDLLLKNHPESTDVLPDIMKNNKQFISFFLRIDGLVLRFAGRALQADRDLVLMAIEQNGCALIYASEELREDKNLVLKAVKQDGKLHILNHVDKKLLADKDFMLEILREEGSALKYVSEELQGDQDFIFDAFKLNKKTEILNYVKKEFLADKNFMLKILGEDGTALKYASEQLKSDQDVVLAAVTENAEAINDASEELQSDRDFILSAIKKNGFVLNHVDEEFLSDRNYLLAAIMETGEADFLENVDEEILGDKEFILKAIKGDHFAFGYASEELKEDRDVFLEAITHSDFYLSHISEKFLSDKDSILMFANRNGMILGEVSKRFQANKNIVLAAVMQNGRTLCYASKKLQADRDVVLAAVREDGLALKYASKKLQADRDVVLAAVMQDGLALEHASEELQEDRDVVLTAVKQKKALLYHLNEKFFSDHNFILEVIHFFSDTFESLPERFRNHSHVADLWHQTKSDSPL